MARKSDLRARVEELGGDAPDDATVADLEGIVNNLEGRGGASASVAEGGVPDLKVKVNEGSTIVHEGKEYTGGDTVVLPGGIAQAFAASQYAQIVGGAE